MSKDKKLLQELLADLNRGELKGRNVDIEELFKKDTPQKAVIVENEHSWGKWSKMVVIEHHCPNCNEEVDSVMNYCCWCGQRLDWENEDE